MGSTYPSGRPAPPRPHQQRHPSATSIPIWRYPPRRAARQCLHPHWYGGGTEAQPPAAGSLQAGARQSLKTRGLVLDRFWRRIDVSASLGGWRNKAVKLLWHCTRKCHNLRGRSRGCKCRTSILVLRDAHDVSGGVVNLPGE